MLQKKRIRLIEARDALWEAAFCRPDILISTRVGFDEVAYRREQILSVAHNTKVVLAQSPVFRQIVERRLGVRKSIDTVFDIRQAVHGIIRETTDRFEEIWRSLPEDAARPPKGHFFPHRS